MSVVLGRTAPNERRVCHVCGKRRLCSFVMAGFPAGIGWMVCRAHPDWEPREGVDFEYAEGEG